MIHHCFATFPVSGKLDQRLYDDSLWEKFKWLLKVSKFQNENMKWSHCPKYERKNLKNSVLSIQDKNFQNFSSYFGQCDDFILSFWNLLTFRHSTVNNRTALLVTCLCSTSIWGPDRKWGRCRRPSARHQKGWKVSPLLGKVNKAPIQSSYCKGQHTDSPCSSWTWKHT